MAFPFASPTMPTMQGQGNSSMGFSGFPASGGSFPGMSGGFGMDRLSNGSCPCSAQMSNPMGGADATQMMNQQLQMGEMQMQLMTMMIQLIISLMINKSGQAAMAAAGMAPGGVGAAGGGGGDNGGGGGAVSGGGGSPSGAAGAAPAGSSTGPAAQDYKGPIDINRVVSAVPAGHQKAAKQHFPGILAECQKQGVTDKAQIAYILATTVHESGAGAYMEEFASGSAYEGRKDLGNNQSGDGVRYKGRGYVQITGRNNYTNWSKKLGLDLVGNPKLAEQPGTAARILVEGMKEGSFTGKKLSDYIGNGRQDFEGARRIVNGTDKAGTFADTARKILAAL